MRCSRFPEDVEGVRRGDFDCDRSAVSPAFERPFDRDCEFAEFIKRKFKGTHITLTIVGDDEPFCGEVVDVHGCIIALKKADGIIIFINGVYIATFV